MSINIQEVAENKFHDTVRYLERMNREIPDKDWLMDIAILRAATEHQMAWPEIKRAYNIEVLISNQFRIVYEITMVNPPSDQLFLGDILDKPDETWPLVLARAASTDDVIIICAKPADDCRLWEMIHDQQCE